MEKLLEDAQIKLSVVASDMFGVSGRAILSALIDGQTRPSGVSSGRWSSEPNAEVEQQKCGFFTTLVEMHHLTRVWPLGVVKPADLECWNAALTTRTELRPVVES